MTPLTFLLANLALAFYNVGTIWAHELDIFRSWKLVGPEAFHRIQQMHWRKLPYWVLLPVAIGFAGSIALLWYRPANSPAWAPACAIGCQALTHSLTALTWGRWQAKLAKDPLGAASPWLARILSTHWIRTLLVNVYAVILFIWMIQCLAS